MKIASPRTFNPQTVIEPPISLERPEPGRLEKHQYQVFWCRSDPKDKASTTYDVTVNYFKTGTPEEWINFQKSLEKVFLGQNDSTGAQRFVKIRQLLQGEALSAFDAYKDDQPVGFNRTLDTFKDAVIAVTIYVFHERAAQI